MKTLWAIVKKELKGYIDHPTAYILVVVFLVLNNFLYFRTSFVQGIASLRPMINLLPWIMLFFISALTMRTWAEEKREGTLNVLLSYPVKIWQIILGKYLATVVFVTAMLLLTLLVPISLMQAGDFDNGVIFAQYLGTFFMIMAMVAVGQWASSLTKNQVIAFIISLGVLVAFILIGVEFVVLTLPFPISVVAQQLGILSHFNSITRGIIDVRDILYFISLSFVFLALSYAWLMRLKMRRNSAEWRTLQTSVIVVIIIAVVINLFGQSFTVRADLTEQNLYSLSSATKAALKDLDDTVRLTLYRSRKLPTQIELVSRDVQDILNDYQKLGGRHIDFSIKYPDEDEETAGEAQEKGIPAIQFNVVRQDEFTLQEGYLGLTIEYLDERETIPVVQGIDDLEYRLTRAIVALQKDEKETVGLLSDFGGKTQQEISTFVESIRENYNIKDVALSSSEESEEIPQISEDIDVLFVSAPTQQFSGPALQSVRDYVNRGGKIFWLIPGVNVNQQTLSASEAQTGLEEILSENGIKINKDLVADLSSHETVNFSAGIFTYLLPYPFWVRANVERHVLAGNVQQVALPWPSSLVIEESASNRAVPLIKTTDQGVRQEGAFDINPEQVGQLNENERGVVTLAAVMEDVPSSEGNPSGRWVVISDGNFLENGIVNQDPGNAVLAANAIDWLVQNEALLEIRSKNSQPNALVWESDGQQAFAKWGNVIGVPVIVVLAGGYWIWRRKRKSKLA